MRTNYEMWLIIQVLKHGKYKNKCQRCTPNKSHVCIKSPRRKLLKISYRDILESKTTDRHVCQGIKHPSKVQLATQFIYALGYSDISWSTDSCIHWQFTLRFQELIWWCAIAGMILWTGMTHRNEWHLRCPVGGLSFEKLNEDNGLRFTPTYFKLASVEICAKHR